MPSFICSSRYTIDSKILRKTAQELGWETLRLDGNTIPSWFEPPDSEIALFYTAPHAFDIAKQLDRSLLGCNSDWTVNLPFEFLKREIVQSTLGQAMNIKDRRFVKHSVSKAFPAAVYSPEKLKHQTKSIHPDSLVHISEPVEWNSEFRFFVRQGRIMGKSIYVHNGEVVRDYETFPSVSEADMREVTTFAESVLCDSQVRTPNAFVLDVGFIRDRGWAVVECNECWASGIYGCDPASVLQTLIAGLVYSDNDLTSGWNFRQHYFEACAIGN